MFSTYINLLLGILIPLLAGYISVELISRESKFPLSLRLALAYGVGLGLVAFWMFALYALHQPFHLNVIRIPVLLYALIGMVPLLKRVKPVPPTSPKTPRKSCITKKDFRTPAVVYALCAGALLFYIAQNMYFVFWRSLNLPLLSFDAIATVAFKAKVFYYEPVPPSLGLLPHRTYPLFVPFIESWISFNLRHWDDILMKVIFPLALLSFTVIFYNVLNVLTRRLWALMGCALLFSSNLFIYHATLSYSDFFLMYFNCTAVMLLVLWHQNRTGGLLLLAAVFAGLATFVKLEGTAFLLIYAALFLMINLPSTAFSRTEKLINGIKFFVPSFGIAAAFHLYKWTNNILKEGSGTMDKTDFDLSMTKITFIPHILFKFAKNMLMSGNWSIVWIVLVLSLLGMRGKQLTAESKLIFLGLLMFFGLYFGIALMTTNYVWIAGESEVTTLSRLLLHFYPLAVLLLVLINYSFWSDEGKNTSSLKPK